MSVNWSWKHKLGTIDVVRKMPEGQKDIRFKLNLYAANCVAAIINDFKQVDPETGKKKDMYTFFGFWNDLDHLKRCLGLTKNYDGLRENLYKSDDTYGDTWVKIKLNTYYPEMIKVGALFAKAKHNVELYYKEPKEDKKKCKASK